MRCANWSARIMIAYLARKICTSNIFSVALLKHFISSSCKIVLNVKGLKSSPSELNDRQAWQTLSFNAFVPFLIKSLGKTVVILSKIQNFTDFVTSPFTRKRIAVKRNMYISVMLWCLRWSWSLLILHINLNNYLNFVLGFWQLIKPWKFDKSLNSKLFESKRQ